MNEIISLNNVTKSYGDKTVVDIKNLHIQKNSVYGLIGPNGAGKSTTMKMICGLTSPSSGTISIGGEIFSNKNRYQVLKHIGSLIESPAYYDNLSGYDNLKIVKEYKGLKESDIAQALDIVGLTKHKDKQVKNYSLGMKQRIGIATALIGFPEIIILDEPTNGLDPQAMADMRGIISSLVKDYNSTVLISSHILDEIEKIADSISIIGQGKILYQGTITNFKNTHQSDISLKTSNNIRASQILSDFNAKLLPDSVRLPFIENEALEVVLDCLYQNKIYPYRITEDKKSLEDIFLDFTKSEHL